MELYIVIVILTGAIIVQDIIHKQERKDLYNRIMARDLPEYKQGKARSVPSAIKKHMVDEKKRMEE